MDNAISAAAEAVRDDSTGYECALVVRHIAQEIRQPLSTIESITHYLNMVLPRTEAKARRQLGTLQDEIRHIQWILDDAIHFLNAVPPQRQLLDLTEVVARSFTEWGPEQGAGCTLLLEPELPLVEVDLQQIEHLLRNLMTFFGRVSAPGRSIAVHTYAAASEVRLEITSGALEYAPEDIEPLFEPFADRFPAGSGLALASARRIADAHGARLEVKSDPPASLSVVIAFPVAGQ